MPCCTCFPFYLRSNDLRTGIIFIKFEFGQSIRSCFPWTFVVSAGSTIVPVVSWGPGAPDQLPIFTTLFWRLNVENTFTNHKCHVGLHVTFGLNDSRIPLQYPSWSAKGFVGFFCSDTLFQLAYMIYITNANTRINISSITACWLQKYRLFVAYNHRRVLQRSQDPLVGWGGRESCAVNSQENH